MPNTTYRYTGPNSAITLKVSDGAGSFKDQDVILWRGQNVDLPSDHEVTIAMLRQGLIAPISAAQVADVVADIVATTVPAEPAVKATARAK